MKQIREEMVTMSGYFKYYRRPQDKSWESVWAKQKTFAADCIHDTFHDICWILHLDIDKPKSIRTVYGDAIFLSVEKNVKN